MTLAELLANPILTGIFGGSLAASLLYTLRGVPKMVLNTLQWKFTSEVLIHNDDSAFEAVNEWLGKQTYTTKARKLRLTSEYSEHEQLSEFKIAPGMGYHLMWYLGKPVLVHRSQPDKGGGVSYRREESLTLMTLGDPTFLRRLLTDIADSRTTTATHVEVFLYQGYWRRVARKEKRPLHSVVIPPEQKQRIVSNIEKFKQSKAWYRMRGIPYRRGMLLTGPPGTGKTSLVLALAGYFSMRVYAINLGSLRGDNDLIEAVTSVPENAVLLIEDIDVAQKKREDVILVKEEETTTSGPPKETKESGPAITLSGLLNAIDGVFSRDGRILVMTTNFPEKLDEALKRKGRADITEKLDELGTEEVLTMCQQFLGDRGKDFSSNIPIPIRPADLQEILLQEHQRDEEESVESMAAQ